MCLVVAPTALSQEAIKAPRLVSLEAAALGGGGTAVASGFSSLFLNPAAFASIQGELSVAELTLKSAGPLFDVLGLATANLDQTSMMASLSGLLKGGFAAELDLGGPLALGFIGKGIGLGIFNRTWASIDVPSVSALKMSVNEDIALMGGYAFAIPLGGGSSLDVGFLAKGFLRARYRLQESVLSFASLIMGGDMSQLSQKPFDLITGIGVDLGALVRLGGGFSMGLAARDAFSPCFIAAFPSLDAFLNQAAPGNAYGIVPVSLDFGIAWAPDLGLLSRSIGKLLIVADYRDIVSLFQPLARNAILNLSLGVEARLLSVLSLRAGIYEAYPSAGLGLDLGFMKMNLAMYGRELGLEPGSRPLFNVGLGFQFRY
jgi:hypothetical protein